jgi:hypothetical protein
MLANSAIISGFSFCQTIWAVSIHSRSRGSAGYRNLVAVQGAAESQAERMVRLGEQAHQPGAIIIVVPRVPGAADNGTAPVAEPEVVI